MWIWNTKGSKLITRLVKFNDLEDNLTDKTIEKPNDNSRMTRRYINNLQEIITIKVTIKDGERNVDTASDVFIKQNATSSILIKNWMLLEEMNKDKGSNNKINNINHKTYSLRHNLLLNLKTQG